jgi:hypothetical protein
MPTDAALKSESLSESQTLPEVRPLPAQNVRPYPPSWIDRLTARIKRLPFPAAITYTVAAVISLLIVALNDWMDGKRFLGSLNAFHIVLALDLIYTIALVHFLDWQAGRALARLRPLLLGDEAEYARLRYCVTTIPAKPTLRASLAGLGVGLVAVAVERLALPSVFRAFVLPGNGRYLLEALLVATWFIWGALFFHTFHQLRFINEIYTRHTRIDMDNFEPLFGFSRVSALTAIGVLVIPYAWYASVPGLVSDPAGILFGALFPVVALISFLWPLLGIHNLMVDAKAKALEENARALKSLRGELHARIDAGKLEALGDVSETMSAMRADWDAYEKTPTWPWQPGTPLTVAVALLLPLALWFLQWILERSLLR